MYILYGGDFDKCGDDLTCIPSIHMHATSTHPQLPGFAVNTDRLFFAEEYHLDPHQTYHFQVETIVVVILTLAC